MENEEIELAEENSSITLEADASNSEISRDEILEISRQENKNGDEREKQTYAKANSIGFAIGILVAGIIILVNVIVKDRLPIEVLLIVSSAQAAQSFITAHGVRKTRKLYLTLAIVMTVVSVCFLIMWILYLCGISI